MSPALETTHQRTEPRPVERLSRNVALAATVALILLCLAWELWLAPTGRGTLAVKALPLIAAPLGLWRYRMYTYRWLSLAIWLYVMEGLVRSTSEGGPGQVLALGEVILGVVIFTACTAQIRQRLAAAKAA